MPEETEKIITCAAGEADENESVSEAEAQTEADGQAELIRREAERLLDGRERKLERELRAKLKDERITAVRNAEAKKDAELAELRRRLEESEHSRIMRERELECTKMLDGIGMPTSLAKYAVSEDRDEMLENIAALHSAVTETVRRELNLRLPSPPPETGTRAPLRRDAIVKMSLAELQDAMK